MLQVPLQSNPILLIEAAAISYAGELKAISLAGMRMRYDEDEPRSEAVSKCLPAVSISRPRVAQSSVAETKKLASVLLDNLCNTDTSLNGSKKMYIVIQSFIEVNNADRVAKHAGRVAIFGCGFHRVFRSYTLPAAANAIAMLDGVVHSDGFIRDGAFVNSVFGSSTHNDALYRVVQECAGVFRQRTAIHQQLKSFDDFPKPGVSFLDMFALTAKPKGCQSLVQLMVEEIEARKNTIDFSDVFVAGLEMRGIMLGFALADRLGVPFVPLRKPGKLPGPTLRQSFSKEYGDDAFEVQMEYAEKIGSTVIIVDDVLATGGSMEAAVKLMQRMQKQVSLSLVFLHVEPLYQQWKNRLSDIEVAVCLA